MQNIAALIGRDNPRAVVNTDNVLPDSGMIGIELELEGCADIPAIPGWDVKRDGSLRDGWEYIFRGPSGGDEAVARILAMGKALAGKIKPKPTFRCSTHIHMDVRDLNLEQLRKIVAAYCLFEDVFFDHCSPYRRWSNFCTPYFNNDQPLVRYTGRWSSIQVFGELSKYTSLNLKPVIEFGSVEFRGSHALTTGEELLALSQRMLHLRRIVFESGAEVLANFVERLSVTRLQDVFPSGLSDGYIRGTELVDTCYSNAQAVVGALPLPGQMRLEQPRLNPQAAGDIDPNNIRDSLITINRTVFNRFGLMAPPDGQLPVSQVARIQAALSRVVGIRAPRLRELVSTTNRRSHDIARAVYHGQY